MIQNKRVIGMAALVIAAAILILLAIYGSKEEAYDATDYAMSTVISFHLFGEDAQKGKEEMMAELSDLEQNVMSWRNEESEIGKINEANGQCVTVDARLYQWLEDITKIEELSFGALDISVLPLAKLWDIEGESKVVPKEDQIKDALNKVNYKGLQLLGENQVQLEEGQSIDIGAIGKGIACDELMTIMRENNLSGTVSVGGSIFATGQKPDKTSWKLGIQDPRGESGTILGVVETRDECYISTSGDYEKYFLLDDVRYHHILDPNTGYPADNGIISVTIVTDHGLLGDALSTACFILGLEDGMELAKQYGAQTIFVTESKEIYMTEQIKGQFTLLAEGYEVK